MSTTAITKQTPQALATAADAAYSREQIDLIKQTVAKDTTDLELKLFLYTAQRTGLDPLTKQIHAVKRWDSQSGKSVMAVQTGIDGYRLIADRTGQLAGISDPVFDREDGEHPNKATVTVSKIVDGRVCEFTASARWSEYVQLKKDGTPNSMWKKMPFLMLGKCAESLALRKAFPADLSGVYTFEEMSQADTETEQRPARTETVEQAKQRVENLRAENKLPPPRGPHGAKQRIEDVMCSECRGVNRHLEGCPVVAKQQPQQAAPAQPAKPAAEGEVFNVRLMVETVEALKTKGANPRPFMKLIGRDLEGDASVTMFCFHETPQKHLRNFIGTECEFAVTQKKSKQGGEFLQLDHIIRCEGTMFEENEPIIKGGISNEDIAGVGADEVGFE